MPSPRAPSRREPSAGEFRALVQAGVVDAPGESWYGPLVSRRISYRIARRLVCWGTSPDAVTLAMTASGLVGAALFLVPPGWAWVGGAALLHAWLVLDAVDGEVARGSGLASARGVFLDAFGHWLVNPSLLAALAWTARPHADAGGWALAALGFAAAVWSRAAAELAPLVRAKLARAPGSGRRAPAAGAPGRPSPRAGEGGGRPAGSSRAERAARVLTDAASPVLALTVAAALAVLGGEAPTVGRLVSTFAWALFTAAHLGKAVLFAWRGWRSLPGPGPAAGGP
ncbi:MAG: CDP-alcohol phosphatidyltransferase family protein [Clostridia bacterium]|nr:CDP-alcohol phosphatidyltransferase family protein [Clostridia bacterium]